METAKADAVLRAIKDTACTALMTSDSDHEEKLEAMMPETEVTTLEDFLSGTDDLGDITAEQKELLGSSSKSWKQPTNSWQERVAP